MAFITSNRYHCYMLQISAILVIYSMAQSFPCGQVQWNNQYNQRYRRITGNSEARLGQFPWHVYIWPKTGDYCGGVIINKRWIVTAQHCVKDIEEKSDIRIYAATTQRPVDDSTSDMLEVDRIILHPNYNSYARIRNDIALLKLKSDLAFASTPNIRPICYPRPNYNLNFLSTLQCYVSGFGRDGNNNNRSKLYYAKSKLSNNNCPEGKSLCAWYSQNINGICRGDSGSAVACIVSGVWTALGIASGLGFTRRPEKCHGFDCCKDKFVENYVSLTDYSDWITTETGISRTSQVIILPTDSVTQARNPNHLIWPCGTGWQYSVWINRTRRVSHYGTAQEGQFPWYTFVKTSANTICLGVLISNQWVITVAHCVQNVQDIKKFEVFVGNSDRPIPTSQYSGGLRVRQALLHPHFNTTGRQNNDIALLELQNALSLSINSNIDTACYPQSTINVPNMLSKDCYVLGFGYSVRNRVPQTVRYKRIAATTCSIPERLCKIYTRLNIGCIINSGSPLVCLSNRKWVAMGIWSREIKFGRPYTCNQYDCCIRRVGDDFVSLSNYSDWVLSVISHGPAK